MAEGFFRKYAPKNYESTSAGTRPTSQINTLAAEVMMDIGIDISNQKPKEIDDGMIRNSIKIISMGCMDKDFCPAMFVPRVVDWAIEDPKGKPIQRVRAISDEIEKRIKKMLKEIEDT